MVEIRKTKIERGQLTCLVFLGLKLTFSAKFAFLSRAYTDRYDFKWACHFADTIIKRKLYHALLC